MRKKKGEEGDTREEEEEEKEKNSGEGRGRGGGGMLGDSTEISGVSANCRKKKRGKKKEITKESLKGKKEKRNIEFGMKTKERRRDKSKILEGRITEEKNIQEEGKYR